MENTTNYNQKKEELSALFALQDYIMGQFNDLAIYDALISLIDFAIADVRTELAVLSGAKGVVQARKKKKYVFEVQRDKLGIASVLCNGVLLASMMDESVDVTNYNGIVYTDIVNGISSRIPDAHFIKSLLYSPADDLCHWSEKVKDFFNKDIPANIRKELENNLKRCKNDKK